LFFRQPISGQDTNNNTSNGLLNMKQRVGELGGSIVFENKRGTVIKIKIPVLSKDLS